MANIKNLILSNLEFVKYLLGENTQHRVYVDPQDANLLIDEVFFQQQYNSGFNGLSTLDKMKTVFGDDVEEKLKDLTADCEDSTTLGTLLRTHNRLTEDEQRLTELLESPDSPSLTYKVDEPTTEYEDAFLYQIGEMAKTFLKKNKDYGSSVRKSYDEFETYGPNEGLKYVVGRLNDKMSRIKNIAYGAETHVKDETVTDTLQDLANYAVLAIISYMEHNGTLNIK